MNDDKTNIVKLTNETNNSNIVEFKTSELPQIISNQVHKMKELDTKIKSVMKEAENAKRAANNANHQITFFSGRKEAIEELQSSGKSLASAVETNAEALKLSFEFQKELAEISKFLFMLGASNIAQNRMVVRELELRMKGASQEELSELAKQELISVVRQLKAQEDLLNKQEQFSKRLQEVDKQIKIENENSIKLQENISILEETDKLYEEELELQKETDKRHDEELRKLKETDKHHDNEIAKQKEIDKLHDEELAKQKETDKRHDEELAKQKETDKRHDDELAKQKETDMRHDEELAKQKEIDKRHDEEIAILKETNKIYKNDFKSHQDKIIQQEQLVIQLTSQLKKLNMKINIAIIVIVVAILSFVVLKYLNIN